MNRQEIDWAIVSLVAAYDRVSAAMYELDSHPGLAICRTGGLRGETQQVAADALARVGVLWSQFAALGDRLERAKALRAQRSRPGDDELRELTALLRGPAVGVGVDGTVLDEVASGLPAARLSLADLARNLEAGSAEVALRLTAVDRARTALAALFGPLADGLARARATAASLGGDALPAADLDRLDERLATAYEAAFADPLTAAPGAAGPGPGGGPAPVAGLANLTADLDSATRRLAELGRLRDGYADRAARLRATVDTLAAAEDATRASYAVALKKIANPGLPPAPDSVAALRAHLAQLDHLHQERRWLRLADELAAAERTAAAGHERATRLREAADGLLARRSELRGRLDAYRAKAARMGLIEHAELSERHRAAQDLLYVSPCDLPSATKAVVAYQAYLNDLTERTPPARREPR